MITPVTVPDRQQSLHGQTPRHPKPSVKEWLRARRNLVDEAVAGCLSPLPTRPYLELWWAYYSLTRSKKELWRARSKRTMVTEELYSYMPFDNLKAIFVHVPKCAGVSIARSIFGNLAGGHTTLNEYVSIFEPQHICNYFKFTIVRNPWDRLVSAFHSLKKGGFSKEGGEWARKELGPFNTFDEFVKRWVNKDNIWKWPLFRPQYHFIVERQNKVRMDFVGFLENINEDFDYVAMRLGINCTLKEANKGKHDDYRSYYSDETMRIVAEVYKTDIELLGYTFDNSNLSQQLARRSFGIR